MTYRKKKFLLWIVIALVWMAFIFYKSSQPYIEQDLRPSLASTLPQSVVNYLPNVEFYYDGELVTSELPYDFIEFFIRKGGHVAEFALLAFLVIHSFRVLGWNRAKAVTLGASIALVYAMSDEWHQSFVAGRTGHAIDVGVDSIGISLVVLCYVIVGLFTKRRNRGRISY
ncbi:VanZ family protein [Paenibacillus marinisediminis]